MLSLRPKFLVFLPLAPLVAVCTGQDRLTGAAEIQFALARLNVLGRVLMIGAHPDDEHTATLAYFARGRSMETAYLSLTRGEGGQNLLGPEQGDLLGVIRTQELLAARRIDGAEQFFTRAIDFGFSKTAEESLAKWGRDRTLSDIVWVIRRFRPDVIILCFSGTPRDGHGQHQASAILAKEAFTAAADKARFPEQLQWVQTWQATRMVWNVYGTPPEGTRVTRIDTGEFNPALGYSYTEIAAVSRSMHRSQGMGSEGRRGSTLTSFAPIAGQPAGNDLFDGIDTTWNRVPGGAEVGGILAEAATAFDPYHPTKIVPLLLDARAHVKKLNTPAAADKLPELEETIALAAGLWLDAQAERWDAVPGATVGIHATALARSRVPVQLTGASLDGAAAAASEGTDRSVHAQKTLGTEWSVPHTELPYNQPYTRDLVWNVPPDASWSQPFWLVHPRQGDGYAVPDQLLIGTAENPPAVSVRFRVRIGGQDLEFVRGVHYRYAEGSRGELVRPVAVVPKVAVDVPPAALVFPDAAPKRVEVGLKAGAADAAGQLRLELPAGWRAEPSARDFRLAQPDDQLTLAFKVIPPEGESIGKLRAVAKANGRDSDAAERVISYSHFPPQVVFPPSAVELVRSNVHVLAKRIGYVMGAGDEVPAALRQLGCEVTLLTASDLASGELDGYDAIVTGVRAYNVRPDLNANQHRLFEYVSRGGTLLVQYNVLDWRAPTDSLAGIGPYPLRISRDRVSVEDAPVEFTNPADPLLHKPNPISKADFDGWVQERGLYFPGAWDPRYNTLFESHDPGEPPHPGGTLYTRYGKGVYVLTAYSWFRQLPAGVPGAYRIFANLLSAGKVLR